MVHAMTFGMKMRALMAERGISLHGLAKSIPADVGYLSKISRDLKRPSKAMAERIDAALDAGGELAALLPPGLRVSGAGSLVDATVPMHAKDDDVERRQALMLMGLGAAAPWPVAESLRAALSRVAGASDNVADWREIVSDYARTISTTPPEQILPDLLSDLNEINSLLEAGHPEQQKMLEVAAALAAFTSMATYDSGQPGRAFRWWRTAQQLADKSGYAPVRAYVRARRGADLFYGKKQATQALQLVDEALRIAENTPSVGLAEAYGLLAAVLADDSNPKAHRALDDMARTVDQLAISHEMYAPAWPFSRRVQDTRTAMYVKLGNGAAAVRAGQASPHSWTQLFVATGMVLEGKVDDGLGHAIQTLTQLDPADDRLSVRQQVRDVLGAVPDHARASAGVRELRALTAGKALA